MPQPESAAVRRTYHSPQRSAAALGTRRRIRSAAAELFLANGYATTSMRAVARAAGVAEKTVYLQFATKSALLREVVETAIVGDDEAVPAAGRRWFLAILEAARVDKVRLLAAGTAALHERSGALFAMTRGAAAVDGEVAAMWSGGKQGHLADMTLIAENFAAAGMLPAGRDVGWATDSLYVLVGPEAWDLVRSELNRDRRAYEDWLLTNLGRLFA